MTTLTLHIPVPEGSEPQAHSLLLSLSRVAGHSANPAAQSDSAIRALAANIEHALIEGAEQARAAIATGPAPVVSTAVATSSVASGT